MSRVLILGAGIAGVASALALRKFVGEEIQITVLEIRDTPSNPIGGAVHLTPNGLRALETLGVLSIIESKGLGCDVGTIDILDMYNGSLVGVVDFAGPDKRGYGLPPHRGRRLLRSDLINALHEAAAKQRKIEFKFGVQTTTIEDGASGITVVLSDGSRVQGDLLLGCDGIHSVVRRLKVEPSRVATYTGIAVAIGFSEITQDQRQLLPMKDTSLMYGRQGNLILSYYNARRDSVYLGAIMETPHEASREGWKTKGADQEAVRKDIASRCTCGVPVVNALIQETSDWFLYPVSSLPPHGKWSSETGRIMLLGDAAHAMPPQGESTGIALEDAIVFARILTQAPDRHTSESLKKVCLHYEFLRRPRIDAAYTEAYQRWETVKDSGFLAHNLKKWLTPWFLWWTSAGRRKTFEEDLGTVDLQL